MHALDEATGASLKLSILNPKGRIWTMVAGGWDGWVRVSDHKQRPLVDLVVGGSLQPCAPSGSPWRPPPHALPPPPALSPPPALPCPQPCPTPTLPCPPQAVAPA